MAGSSQSGLRTRFAHFLPRFDEPISIEFYRFTGKLRFFVVLAMMAFNVIAGAQSASMEIEPDVYWQMQAPNMLVLGTDAVLAWILWKRPLTMKAMRRLVLVGALLECLSVLRGMWYFGSVSSHMFAVAILILFAYRVAFDFRTGTAVALTLIAGQWIIVAAEIAGWIPTQPVNPGAPDFMYGKPSRVINTAAFNTVIMAVAFVIANWAVARLRHKERAVRMLREALAAANPTEVGRHTGRTLSDTYEVGGVIAAGGMGEVYRGRHLRTRRPVAIKLLHTHLVDDPSLLARFRREAEIAGALGSRHIVEVIDVAVDDGQPYLVLELLEGEDLKARIDRDGPLPLALVADLSRQLAEALRVAHAAHVVHRDLKPANVFLCREEAGDHLKILDFGVSKIRSNATAITQEVALLGTPDFMAPEQALGAAGDLGPEVDIFAAGAILYCALTGVPPFQASTIPAVLRRILEERPISAHVLRPEIPTAVDDVLSIAMAKRAEDRYASAPELSRDLALALEDRLPTAVTDRARALDRGKRRAATVDADADPTAHTVAE